MIDEPVVTAVSNGDGYVAGQAEGGCALGRWKYAMLPTGVVYFLIICSTSCARLRTVQLLRPELRKGAHR